MTHPGKRPSPALHGVLNIHKPASWTSHDVVGRVRRILGESQIGHLGTLDPLATGVLPLAVGTATRLIEFASYTKTYQTTCLLGKTTDSCDVTGKVLSESSAAGLSEEQVRREGMKLQALTEQIPPMVSAVKIGGKKLYELARRGMEVERQARPIRLESVEILSVQLPRVVFRVVCSPGTYVRVLCQTLGEALGVGGCMETLERTQVGPFFLAQSASLEKIQKAAEEKSFSEVLFPSSLLVGHLPEVSLDEAKMAAVCQGKSIDLNGDGIVSDSKSPSGLVRILNSAGRLCAIGRREGLILKPKKVFGIEGIL